ncbi:M56 family metallopeptidase [Enterococcus cecorum]
MIISISAVLSSLFIATILIFILFFIHSINILGVAVKFEYLLFVSLLIVLRIVIPFEWPWTHTIYSKKLFPPITDITYIKLSNHVYVYQLLLLIWFIGSIVVLSRFFIKTIRLNYLGSFTPNYKDEFQSKYPNLKLENVKGIYLINGLSTPLVISPVKPEIFIPKYNYTNEELYYILKHEVQHIKNNDLYFKFILQLLVCIYWWFLPIYLLSSMINYFFELRVDYQVNNQHSEAEILDYFQTLTTSAIRFSKLPAISNRFVSSQFTMRKESLLKKRILFYFEETQRKQYKLMFLIPLIVTLIALPTFTFEPSSIDEHTRQTTLSEEEIIQKCYILDKKNGEHWLSNKKTNKQTAIIKKGNYFYNKLEHRKEK